MREVERSAQLSYIPVVAAAMAVMFIRTLLAARLLEVPEFGLFGVGMLVSNSFCVFGCFGFYLLLQRDLPMLIVKGRRTRGALVLHQTLVFALVGFVGFMPLSFLELFSVSPAFFAISLLNGLAQQAFLIVTLQSRSEGRSMRFAVDNLLRSVAVLAAIILSGWVYGTASSMLLVEALVTLMMAAWVYTAMGSEGAIGRAALWVGAAKSLSRIRWRAPLTLMATGILGFAMLNGDRWVAASWLSRDDFALYAFAGIVLILAQSLQSVINVSVFPGLAKKYALNGSAAAAFTSIKYSLIAFSCAALLSLPAFFMANHVIERFFQEYVPTREFLALFFLIASLRVSDFLSSYLIIAGRERLLLATNIGAVSTSVAAWLGYYGFEAADARTASIAWLAALVAVSNYVGCLLVVAHCMKAGR